MKELGCKFDYLYPFFDERFKSINPRLNENGTTIILVTHDVEFAAEYLDSCAMLFDGGIVNQTSPQEFFSKNYFYTTVMNRVSRDFIKGAVTLEDVSNVCKILKV